MSELSKAQPKPKAPQLGPADRHVIARVEKWLEMIREISRDPTKR